VVTIRVDGEDVLDNLAAVKLPKAISNWFRTRPSANEKLLLQRCAGDEAQMERLIRYELARRPQLSRSLASESALDRWNRDR
jgi:hypothetical protein